MKLFLYCLPSSFKSLFIQEKQSERYIKNNSRNFHIVNSRSGNTKFLASFLFLISSLTLSQALYHVPEFLSVFCFEIISRARDLAWRLKHLCLGHELYPRYQNQNQKNPKQHFPWNHIVCTLLFFNPTLCWVQSYYCR